MVFVGWLVLVKVTGLVGLLSGGGLDQGLGFLLLIIIVHLVR